METIHKTLAEIKSFFDTLHEDSIPSPQESGKSLSDIGLIILEPSIPIHPADLNFSPPDRTVTYVLDSSYDSEGFTKRLIEANKAGQWLLVDCKVDPAPDVLQVLKQLNDDNTFTVSDVGGQEMQKFTLNPATRIVFFIHRDTLENTVTHPYFLSLFGPVLRMD